VGADAYDLTGRLESPAGLGTAGADRKRG
jgi:hypothetical protein